MKIRLPDGKALRENLKQQEVIMRGKKKISDKKKEKDNESNLGTLVEIRQDEA